MTFSDLGLDKEILQAISDAGYTEPTEIQEQAIPYVLMNRDILGCAQTGTGKTASFTLPMIEILHHGRRRPRMPRSLILEPTRELAAQVAANFDTYGKYHKLTKALLIGGTSMDEQIKTMNRGGVDVLIATPGRLMDLFDRGKLLLTDVKVLVIDEADRMLDMGFIPDVEKIVSLLPPMRQTLFFSATMPPEIRRLADKFLQNPKEITVSRKSSAAETVTQGLMILAENEIARGPGGAQKSKRNALRALIEKEDLKNAIVFCNRKRDVAIVYKSLVRHGYSTAQLHGDMSQIERMRTLAAFKAGEAKIMVCSDVAARGIDIPALSHVFNFDVPTHAEDYVHRIGRTGRAGREGTAYSLATSEDKKYIKGIEQMLGMEIPRLDTADLDASIMESGRDRHHDSSNSDSRRGGGNSSGGRGRRGGQGRPRGDRPKADAAPSAAPAAEKPNAAPEAEGPKAEPAKVEAAAKPKPEPAPKPQAEKPASAPQKPKRERRPRTGDGAGVDTEGALPAFLMRDPLANLKEETPEKKPRKRPSSSKKAG